MSESMTDFPEQQMPVSTFMTSRPMNDRMRFMYSSPFIVVSPLSLIIIE